MGGKEPFFYIGAKKNNRQTSFRVFHATYQKMHLMSTRNVVHNGVQRTPCLLWEGGKRGSGASSKGKMHDCFWSRTTTLRLLSTDRWVQIVREYTKTIVCHSSDTHPSSDTSLFSWLILACFIGFFCLLLTLVFRTWIDVRSCAITSIRAVVPNTFLLRVCHGISVFPPLLWRRYYWLLHYSSWKRNTSPPSRKQLERQGRATMIPTRVSDPRVTRHNLHSSRTRPILPRRILFAS